MHPLTFFYLQVHAFLPYLAYSFFHFHFIFVLSSFRSPPYFLLFWTPFFSSSIYFYHPLYAFSTFCHYLFFLFCYIFGIHTLSFYVFPRFILFFAQFCITVLFSSICLLPIRYSTLILLSLLAFYPFLFHPDILVSFLLFILLLILTCLLPCGPVNVCLCILCPFLYCILSLAFLSYWLVPPRFRSSSILLPQSVILHSGFCVFSSAFF